MDAAETAIFERVERLTGRSPSLADLDHHRLQLSAARCRRARDLPVSAAMVARERSAAASALAAPAILRRVRDAVDGPILLIKGPDVARYYPDPVMRPFGDLDLIVPDSTVTQRQLLDAGFEEVGDPARYEDIHHLRPVASPGLPLAVEVHHAVKWVDGLRPPTAGELLDAAVPAPVDLEGILALPPAHHAVVLAAHAWSHRPLGKVGDLLDIALVARHADAAELDRLARAWGIRRVWRVTVRAIDHLFAEGSRPLALAVWARHLAEVRERTVLEAHVESWLSALWGLPVESALAAGLEEVRRDLLPGAGEDWKSKRARVRAALSDAFVRKSQHDEALGAWKEA
jgi:Uncharacterised nucleotidyltransferase